MTAVVVRRPARQPAPEMPADELVLEAPPEIPAPADRQWTGVLTMLPMVVIMAAFVLMSGTGTGPLRLVVLALVGVAVVVVLLVALVRGGGVSGAEMGRARRAYLRQLSQHRRRLRRSIRQQRQALAHLHPEPAQLWAVAAGYRLWERRPGDADFAVVRLGVGPQQPGTALVVPETKPLEQLDPLSALALRRFVRAYSVVADLPLAVPLTGFGRIHLGGDRDRAVALVRALLAQLVTVHPPGDVLIAVCPGPGRAPAWEWVKWLPHALHPALADAAGPLRLVAPTVAGLEAMLTGTLAGRPRFDPDQPRAASPQLVVVLDGGAGDGSELLLTGGGVEGVTILDLSTPPPRAPDRATLVLDVGPDGTLAMVTSGARTGLGRADGLDPVLAEALARQLAPLRLGGGPGEPVVTGDLGLAELLGLGDPYAFDPDRTWGPRPDRDRLRVMFGVGGDGTPVELDLKESSQEGMGPHGVLIGATGSGKSELLRTLVLALAVTHPPSSLNFVLVDFKGGATFTRLDALPHTSAVITNLGAELPLVDRMTDALTGELVRRQELLRAAGNFASVRDYDRARAAGAPLPEVPTLLVICDEFSELLTAKPDFIHVFVQIGRLGRALGVHLLLASQRLEEGRLRGMDGHLSYRIGLRTFGAQDSRAVLGVTDAFELPRAPGHGLMRYGTEPLTRFRAAYVSGVHRPPQPAGPGDRAEARIVDYTTRNRPEDPVDPADNVGQSLLDILVDRLTGRGTPAHVVWLPPLSASPALDRLPQPPAGQLRITAGLVDRPLEQRRDPLELDLSGAAGHVLVTGGPLSGRSTALRTLIAALALTHSPAQVQIYGLDFGGGTLATLRGLPHVGGVAGRQHPGAVRRTVAQLAALLAERERRFAEHDVPGIAAYRAARARGRFADDPYGDVFLVVDGWPAIRKEFEDLEDPLADLATRGLTYGLHLVVSGLRATDLRPAVRDVFGGRIELRLGDPADTAVDRLAAQRVPVASPGRGLAPSRHQMVVALPRIDGVSSAEDLAEATAALVSTVAARWPGVAAPRVRLLPATVDYGDLPPHDEDPCVLTVGLDEQHLAPVRLDFAAEPHLVLLGDSRSGKTAFLRLLARRITGGSAPGRARIVLLDHRRGLLGEIGAAHLLGHGTDPVSSRNLVAELARGLAERVPPADVTPEQLRNRSWWRGPEVFLLVDDYDLVVSPGDNPLQPLVGYLPQARELGLHVIVTRRTGGAGRALFEPFLARLRDVGAPGLQLSGDRGEGPLLGGLKAEPLPPGRGRLIMRGRPPQMLQLAWTPPSP